MLVALFAIFVKAAYHFNQNNGTKLQMTSEDVTAPITAFLRFREAAAFFVCCDSAL